jgi:hypothetical protein
MSVVEIEEDSICSSVESRSPMQRVAPDESSEMHVGSLVVAIRETQDLMVAVAQFERLQTPSQGELH